MAECNCLLTEHPEYIGTDWGEYLGAACPIHDDDASDG